MIVAKDWGREKKELPISGYKVSVKKNEQICCGKLHLQSIILWCTLKNLLGR